ncbi:MAG: DUF4162 domain-containing protein, partial [Anaerolineaceae bacterium]|nr:DUF4162 domain-containing protein [Anaerolineaceae bacterium]
GLLKSTPGVLEVAIHGARLHVTLAEAGREEEIGAGLSQAGVTVRSLDAIQPSLEDVFLYMVQQRQTSAANSSGE